MLAWRFHASRAGFAMLVLFLAYQSVEFAERTPGIPATPAWPMLLAVAVLVPIDFVVIAASEERGFTVAGIAPLGLFLAVQVLTVAVLAASSGPVPVHGHPGPAPSLPIYVWGVSIAAGLSLLVRTLFTNKPMDSALLWALIAFLLFLLFRTSARISSTYSVASLLVVASCVIETSYLLAYRDELTMLPSRRAFNDALSRLQDPYSIAVVDIDHFKRFNDTYGHDVGDQVLCLVAARLARVGGGGEAYRCGGEEFAVLFPKKSLTEVGDHLERLRRTIESAEFQVRGTERRQIPRGPDRRGGAPRNRGRKGDTIRRLAHRRVTAPLSVTVSIGVADSSRQMTGPHSVLQAADKALYRAKASGRNRIESAAARRRVSAKSTGVA